MQKDLRKIGKEEINKERNAKEAYGKIITDGETKNVKNVKKNGRK